MEILELKKIAPEEADIFGQEIVNLATLSRAGFSVPAGLVVSPPEIKLRSVLEHFNLSDKEIFEQKLVIIKKEIEKIPVPEELSQALKKRNINAGKIWLDLLNVWLLELRKAIWKEGLSNGLTRNLNPQPIFFISKIKFSGKAFINPEDKSLVVEEGHDLTDSQLCELEEIVQKGNKILFLPKVYFFIAEYGKNPGIKIVKLLPFTGFEKSDENFSVDAFGLSQKANFEEKKSPEKSALKIFLDFSNGLTFKDNADGFLICADKINGFDEKVFKVVEAAQVLLQGQVIFKFSERAAFSDNLRKEEAQVLNFARKKKNLINVSLAVPSLKSSHEFLKFKKDLAVLGISRKGSLKLFLELGVPENILNIEDYIASGLDGVIINLDEIAGHIGGFEFKDEENVFYKAQVGALKKLLEGGLRQLHKAKVIILVSGSLSLHDEMLEFLIGKGVSGIVADLATSSSLNEHLRFVEKRLIRKKLS